MPVIAHFLQHALTVDFFLQPAQSLFNRLALFEFDLSQFNSHPLCDKGKALSGEERLGLGPLGVNGQTAKKTSFFAGQGAGIGGYS